jgi:UDP-galactose transporter B1
MQNKTDKIVINIDASGLTHKTHNNVMNGNGTDAPMNNFAQVNNPFSDHSPSSPIHSNFKFQSKLYQVLDMAMCIAGIYASFMIMSVYQERVTRRPYGEDERKFKFPLFLVFAQCVLNSLVAYVRMRLTPSERSKSQVPSHIYAMTAFAYVMATISSNAALGYVNYPTQVLAKSCKAIPVMILSVLIAKKSYSFSKYVVVVFISLGISVFMLSRFSSDKKNTDYDDNNVYGLMLLLISLFSDGFTNSLQTIMNSYKVPPSGNEMMLFMNIFAAIFAGLGFLIPGQLIPAISFCFEYPEIILDIIIFCICMAIGQIFIFWCIASYGPLVCTIVTTTRKFFTILFSVFWYGHEMSFGQWSGVFLVFVGLSYDIVSNLSNGHKKVK